mmetsp:Transcript_70538/g.194953  ORF Transcript_70538/g.194953 Transcript_70538/m.194953 type:complete len:306 (-) Transcript_70538:853-1770(-)
MPPLSWPPVTTQMRPSSSRSWSSMVALHLAARAARWALESIFGCEGNGAAPSVTVLIMARTRASSSTFLRAASSSAALLFSACSAAFARAASASAARLRFASSMAFKRASSSSVACFRDCSSSSFLRSNSSSLRHFFFSFRLRGLAFSGAARRSAARARASSRAAAWRAASSARACRRVARSAAFLRAAAWSAAFFFSRSSGDSGSFLLSALFALSPFCVSVRFASLSCPRAASTTAGSCPSLCSSSFVSGVPSTASPSPSALGSQAAAATAGPSWTGGSASSRGRGSPSSFCWSSWPATEMPCS